MNKIKKLLTIILSALYLFMCVCFVGCSQGGNVIIPTGDYPTDYEGVYLTIESIDNTGEHTELNVEWHNETDYEVVYTPPYQIEYKNGEEWVNIQKADFNYAYTEITIEPQKTKIQKYSTANFDVSKTGIYRLRTNCKVLTNDNPTCNLWVEFAVKDSSEVEKHKVTAELDDWLHSGLKQRYKAGETVVVKINLAHDAAFSLYMNGKALQRDKWESGQNYWKYTFTMPNEDVVLTYKVSNGMQMRPIIEQVEYLDSVVYRFDSSLAPQNSIFYINDIATDEYSLAFEEMRFVEVTDIPEVEESLIRFTLDIICIDTVVRLELASPKTFWIQSIGKMFEIINEVDFFEIYEDYLFQGYISTLLIRAYKEKYPQAGTVTILHYFGIYEGGAMVAMLAGNNEGFDSAIWTETVAGYDFNYLDGNRIRVLYGNEFYTLTAAYENGYLTKENIKDISNKQTNVQKCG